MVNKQSDILIALNFLNSICCICTMPEILIIDVTWDFCYALLCNPMSPPWGILCSCLFATLLFTLFLFFPCVELHQAQFLYEPKVYEYFYSRCQEINFPLPQLLTSTNIYYIDLCLYNVSNNFVQSLMFVPSTKQKRFLPRGRFYKTMHFMCQYKKFISHTSVIYDVCLTYCSVQVILSHSGRKLDL